MNEEDREFILDILNYEFTDILKSLGFNTDGGKFVFAKKEGNTLSQHIDIVTKLNAMGLPMDDDYLYETFAVRKPANYDEIKKAKEEQKKALKLAFSAVALEMKDVQGGGKFDWTDLAVTVIGSILILISICIFLSLQI